jgi:hypothetical protein
VGEGKEQKIEWRGEEGRDIRRIKGCRRWKGRTKEWM